MLYSVYYIYMLYKVLKENIRYSIGLKINLIKLVINQDYNSNLKWP